MPQVTSDQCVHLAELKHRMPGLQSGQVLFLLLLWTGFAHTTGEARRVHTRVLIANRDRPLAQSMGDTAMQSMTLRCNYGQM